MNVTEPEAVWILILSAIVILFALSLIGLLSAALDGYRIFRRWKAMR